MVMVKFRSGEDYEKLLKKVKKMREFTEELEECLMESMEGETQYRGGSYRREYDEDEMRHEGRYGYRGRM